MKQICFSFFLITLFINNVNGQKKGNPICITQKINVYTSVKGYPYQKEITISKDSLLNGFELSLSDTSYKMISFRIFFEFPGDPFGEEIIMNNKITTQNIDFLPHIKGYGDGYFEFSCIAVEKNGKIFNAPDFFIMLHDK